VGAIQAGLSITEAARQHHFPRKTAADIWNKFLETGSTHNRPRSGRPPKITERTERQVIREVRKHRRMPFRDIGNHVEPQISENSIRRVLAKKGYHRRIAKKVPYLSTDQRKARMKWAHEYEGFKDEDWHHVIWSDECYVYLGDKNGRIYVTRRADEVLLEECLVPTFKQSTIRVMVWACIMKDKKGPLVVLEYPGGRGGGMNSIRYQQQVLDGALLAFYRQMKLERGLIKFQQDGAPSHRSKSTMKWFRDHDISLFPHPASSPDLNPIEPCWHELKSRLRALPHLPTTVDALCEAVHEVWESLSLEDINRHVRTMNERVQAVLKAKGGHTRF
jgi:transposase